MLDLALVGLNHTTAEVAMRERAAVSASRLPETLQALARRPSIEEALILSTCNRVELLARVRDAVEGLESLEHFLVETSTIGREELATKVYRYTGPAVVRHLFRVASSLDSMIVGEPQILGQVKTSYSAAIEAGTVGPTLNGLIQAALHAAKRVRTETSIGEYAISVSSAAVELARKIFGRLQGKHILIVGAGKMSKLAARHLRRSGADRVRVCNRSPEAARELAEAFDGEAVPFDAMATWIGLSDIVITSTGSPEVLVDVRLARDVMAHRNRPIVFVDISVPRNVEAAVGELDNVFCYDVDDLGSVVEANMQERRRESALAERVVDAEADAFCDRMRATEATPVVVELQGRIQEICRAELDRYLRRAGPHATADREELEAMVSRIAGKIAHPLITQARRPAHDPLHHSAYLDMLRRIFKLEKS